MSKAPPPLALPPDTTDDAFLGGALQLLQPRKGYRAGVDAVLLAATVAARASMAQTLLDAGAGVGAVGLAAARRVPSAEVVLLERQPELLALAGENIARNGLAGRVRAVDGDIDEAAGALAGRGIGPDSFDHALANPPFHLEGHGTPAAGAGKAAAHAMPVRALEGWGRFLARVVKPGGTATMIHKAEALADVLAAFDRRFGGLVVLPVAARAGEPAIRVIVRGTKASRAPLALLAPFVLHGDGQAFTPRAASILREGAPLELP